MQPEEGIEPVAGLPDAVLFSVSDEGGHHAEDVGVFDAVFSGDAIVAEDHVVVGSYLDDPVQDIAVRRALIEHHVADFAPRASFFADGEEVPALAQQREHADAYVGVGQAPFTGEVGLEGDAATHQGLRFCEVLRELSSRPGR